MLSQGPGSTHVRMQGEKRRGERRGVEPALQRTAVVAPPAPQTLPTPQRTPRSGGEVEGGGDNTRTQVPGFVLVWH